MNFSQGVNERYSSTKSLTLIGHRICPYVQRVVITLEELGLDYEKVDINLSEKPSWLKHYSPGEKVPVLTESGSGVLFDSEVICEYLYNKYDEQRYSVKSLEKANHQAWCKYSSEILNRFAQLIYSAKDNEAIDRQLFDIRASIQQLTISNFKTPYFSGDQFSIVDAHFAPLFRYICFFGEALGYDFVGPKSHLLVWIKKVLERNSVASSVPASYNRELTDLIMPLNPLLYKRIRSPHER